MHRCEKKREYLLRNDMNTGKQYTQKCRSRPRDIDGQALSEAIRIKAKELCSSGVKVKFDISKMSRKQKVGYNGYLDGLIKEGSYEICSKIDF